MSKIKDFFSNFFRKRKRGKVLNTKNSNKVLLDLKKKKKTFKKRNVLSVKINLTKPLKFFKKNYIPYYLIFWLFLIVWIAFVILWPIFRVETINIIKKDWITNINIAYKAVEDFRWTSIFNIDKQKVLDRLKDYQENIKDISLNIDFPKTISITIESYKEKFNVTINKKSYTLLENGSLIPTINPSNELKNLEIIKNIEKTKILDYKAIFDMEYIKKIEEIEKKVKENISWIDIKSIKYYEKEREFHIIVNNFTRLIFSLDNNISVDEQIKSLAVMDREKSQISNNDKVYVDLRINWKVLFCSIVGDKNKQKENQCNENIKYIYGET